jgi:hypothetical protein
LDWLFVLFDQMQIDTDGLFLCLSIVGWGHECSSDSFHDFDCFNDGVAFGTSKQPLYGYFGFEVFCECSLVSWKRW